jgi:hypothetical protein
MHPEFMRGHKSLDDGIPNQCIFSQWNIQTYIKEGMDLPSSNQTWFAGKSTIYR